MTKVRVVLTDSADVAESVDRVGLLNQWFGAPADSPSVEVEVVDGARLDMVAQRAGGDPPVDIAAPRGLDQWLRSQLLPWPGGDSAPTLIVLSASETLTQRVLRHRESGWLVSAPAQPTPEQSAWLAEAFEEAPADTDAIGEALVQLDATLGDTTEIVVLNVSSYIPGEPVHWFRRDDPEPMSLLANRLDLVIDKAAVRTRIRVVDVDRIVAELGAEEAVLGPARYSAAATAAITEEVVTLLGEMPALSTILGLEVMRLEVPRHDRRTSDGVLVEWHVTPPCRLKPGVELFDIRFENIHSRLGGRQASGRSLQMTVVATRDGHLREVAVGPGERVSVGSSVGIVTEKDDSSLEPGVAGIRFPVGIKVAER